MEPKIEKTRSGYILHAHLTGVDNYFGEPKILFKADDEISGRVQAFHQFITEENDPWCIENRKPALGQYLWVLGLKASDPQVAFVYREVEVDHEGQLGRIGATYWLEEVERITS